MSAGTSSTTGPSVFISASDTVDTSVLREALRERGYTPLALDEVATSGKGVSDLLREYIPRADFFVAVIGDDSGNRNVFYELGFAQACNKRVLAFAPSGIRPQDDRIAYLKVDPTNREAIDFGLDSILSAPEEARRRGEPVKQTRPIGDLADELIGRVRAAQGPGEPILVEKAVIDALQASGVRVHSTVEMPGDLVFDIAVWSDDLGPWIANPLLIELTAKIKGEGPLREAVSRMVGRLNRSGAGWGMLLCKEVHLSESEAPLWRQLPANILGLTVEEFFEGLRAEGFGDLVIRLRNDRLHKGR